MTELTLYKSKEDWMIQLDEYYNRFKTAGWDFIITLREGIDQFGRTDPAKADLYEEVSPQLGLAVRTLQNLCSAARSPAALVAQEEELTIYHVVAVQALPAGEAEAVLHKAKAEGWSAEEVKTYLWQERMKASHGTMQRLPAPLPAEEVANRPASVTRQNVMEVADARHAITYKRWPTTTGLVGLPPLMTQQEHRAMVTYINSSADLAAWARGDYMIQIENEANHRARLERWTPARYADELAVMYADASAELHCSPETLRLNEKTARMFHESLRLQTATIGYEHHELLTNRSRAEAMEYLDRAQREGWTPKQLQAELHIKAELSGGRA